MSVNCTAGLINSWRADARTYAQFEYNTGVLVNQSPRWGGLLLVLASVAACIGCDDPSYVMRLDVRTDLVPYLEFDELRVERLGVLEGSMQIGPDGNWSRSRELGVFDLPQGDYVFEVSALLDGREILERRVAVDLRSDQSFLMLLTRDCRGVECPGDSDSPTETACLGGGCVEPSCLTGDAEGCASIEAACERNRDCPDPPDVCAEAECVSGVCLIVPRADVCSEDERCSPEDGCVAVAALSNGDGDAGTDASGEDAGADATDGEAEEEDAALDADEGDVAMDGGGDGSTGECVSVSDCVSPANTSAECDEGTCIFDCVADFADCNDDDSDGCEVDLNSDPTHCGSCGTPCGAGQVCGAATCSSTCGFTDCSGSCVDTERSLEHCGGCGMSCEPEPSSNVTCGAGTCVRNCSLGLGDCDSNLGTGGNGCETDFRSDTANCGACNNQCPWAQNAEPSICSGATCAPLVCMGGYDDCDGDLSAGELGNGCEVFSGLDENNCGSCGNVCDAVANADLQTCVSGSCLLAGGLSCLAGFDDCDGNASNGCEVDLSTRDDCGSCSIGTCLGYCDTPDAITTMCTFTMACDPGAVQCGTACVDTLLHPAHCGGCGQKCSALPNTVTAGGVTCDAGECLYDCEGAFLDCNNDLPSGAGDGCEINSDAHHDHCGGCDDPCTADQECAGGVCQTRS